MVPGIFMSFLRDDAVMSGEHAMGEKGVRLSVVVPLYNEEENVPLLQGELNAALAGWQWELVLVDDGSTDGTRAAIIREPHVRVLAMRRNSGQSAAMYVGIQAARGEYIGLLDGDLQNDPADLPQMVEYLEAAAVDLVCGYRARRRDTWSKRVASRIANAVRSRFTGDGVRDTGCTLKVMKRECREALVPFYGMHRFLPALIKGAGYRLAEVGVNHRPRQYGVSKYSVAGRAWKATMDMFGVRWLISRRLHLGWETVGETRGEASGG